MNKLFIDSLNKKIVDNIESLEIRVHTLKKIAQLQVDKAKNSQPSIDWEGYAENYVDLMIAQDKWIKEDNK